jgi:hypothetical protein
MQNIVWRLTVLFVAGTLLPLGAVANAQSTSVAPGLVLFNAPAPPVTLSLAEFRALPHRTLQVQNPHDRKNETYEGVLLLDLLAKVGAPLGENLRGKELTTRVIAEAADDYRVVFSLAELDTSIGDAAVFVADRMEGAPLYEKTGPLLLVVPKDKRHARWVRMLKTLRVVHSSD